MARHGIFHRVAPRQENGEDGEGDHGQQAVAEDAVAAVQVARDAVLGGVAGDVLGDEPQRKRRQHTPAQDKAEVHLPAPLRDARQHLSEIYAATIHKLSED